MSNQLSLLVLGCGNMAQALVEGMYQADDKLKITTYTPSKTRAIALAAKVQGTVLDSLAGALPPADFIMLACKPQQFRDLAEKIRGKISADSTILSILAGTQIKSLQNKLDHQKVVRIMPNTPALVGAGVNAFYFDSSVEAKSKKQVLQLFASFSEVFDFEKEEQVDTITPYSGSGPAYFFELTRILIDHLSSQGIERDKATRILKATAFGAGKLLTSSQESAETLRKNVTSKGGVTFEALKVFEQEGLEEITGRAMEAALKRNKELAQESGQ